MKDLSKKELAAIDRVRRAFDALPRSLIIYVVDDRMYACKKGSPSILGSWSIVSGVICTNMLADVHDDMDYGRG